MASPLCHGVDYRKRVHVPSPSGQESDASWSGDDGFPPIVWRGTLEIEELENLFFQSEISDIKPVLGLIYVYGSWVPRIPDTGLASNLETWLRPLVRGWESRVFCGKINLTEGSVDHLRTLPPAELPALAICSQGTGDTQSQVEYLPLKPTHLYKTFDPRYHEDVALQSIVVKSIHEVVQKLGLKLNRTATLKKSDHALRIFVAGDRSSVGKSSVCLGILGSLLRMGYSPSDLAYIKPATQSESKQLIQTFCEARGIACVPIGPLVYYRGFTRAFLAGETASTKDLLADCSAAVDRLARGRQVVLMDGVGFPAVGSICGTDNANVAMACSYPMPNGTRKPVGVLLVGGSGVGSAVDAFNLNASYFERAHLPVLGAIFNKLSTDRSNFYSLENCREQVTKYFDQSQSQRVRNCRPFGFCPIYDKLNGPETSETLAYAEEWIHIFGQHVDVPGILQAAYRIKNNADLPKEQPRPVKRLKTATAERRRPRPVLSRQEIEQAAIRRGAPVSA